MNEEQYNAFIYKEVLSPNEIKELTEAEKDVYFKKLRLASEYEHKVFGW